MCSTASQLDEAIWRAQLGARWICSQPVLRKRPVTRELLAALARRVVLAFAVVRSEHEDLDGAGVAAAGRLHVKTEQLCLHAKVC